MCHDSSVYIYWKEEEDKLCTYSSPKANDIVILVDQLTLVGFEELERLFS